MTAYRPKLRAYLRVADGELVDELLDRTVPLEDVAAAVAALLDGTADWDAIHDGLVADGRDPDDVDGALRGLLLLHAVEGAGDALAARLERVVRGEEALSPSILEGARFACQGSGECCSGYAFGPLSDGDVARLEALDLAAAFPHLAPPYLDVRDDGRYLRKDGDRCVFLAGDRRCGLHAAFGADAKPGLCRLYPHDSVATIDGFRVVDRGTCATFGVSARTGTPLIEDLIRLGPLLDPPSHLHHPIARVDDAGWDHGLYLRFNRAAIELVGRNLGTAGETLHAIGRSLDALAVALAHCPLEPGQPDEMVTRMLAIPAEAWYRAPRPDAAARGKAALGSVLRELAGTVMDAARSGAARSAVGRFRDFAELLVHTADVIAAGDADAAPAAHAPEVDLALRVSLRQQLFGRRVLVDDRAGAGLVRIGLIQLCALSGARQGAGARPLVAADLSGGHMLATRVFYTGALDELIAGHDARWRQLLDGLAAAIRIVSAP